MVKLTKILAGALAALGLVTVAATAGVNAEDPVSYSQYGTYTVSNSGKTATWDFSKNIPDANVEIKTTSDDILGLSTSSSLVFKSSDKKLCLSAGKDIYIPVPAAATGKVSFVCSDAKTDRFLYFAQDDKTTTTNYVPYTKSTNEATFATSNIVTVNEKTYLHMYNNDTHRSCSDATKCDKGDFKFASLVVTLDDTVENVYEASKAIYSVTVKDGESTLATKSVTEGLKLTYTPAKWGYDFAGYYTDAALETEFNAETTNITAATTLYTKWTAWTDVNANTITTEQLAKVTGLDCTNDVELTGTVYTLKAGNTVTSGYIATSGGVDKTKGVKVVVSEKSTLTVTLTTGGTSARNAKVVDSSNNAITATTGNAVWTASEANDYVSRTLTYTLATGEYYVGGTNGMRITGLSLAKYNPLTIATQTSAETMAASDSFRILGTIAGVDDLAKVTSIVVDSKLTKAGSETPVTGSLTVDTVYTSVTDVATMGEVAGTYYVVITVTDIHNADYLGSLELTLKVTIDGVEYTKTASAITLVAAAE